MAAAPPPCSAPTAWVGLGPALPPQPPPVRRRHARELRAPPGHGPRPPAGSRRLAAGGRVCLPLPAEALEGLDLAGQARRELRPGGIEEDEKPNEYPSGASINVSMWDMIEKNFPELGNERRLQGSSSSASPGTEKRSAGDRKRDRKWREYQESLAAEAAQGAKGGTPAPSPQRASGGHHPGQTTLGDFLQVAKPAKAKPRQLHLRKSGPSSDVESAHRGRMPAHQAGSSSSVASDQRDVARACERACGPPCNLRVARQRATQQKAAVEGAVGIAQQEAAEWAHGMAIHAATVAAIAAGLTAAAAHQAAIAQVKGEVAAADEEARLTQEAIACKEAEVKALEEALAQERAKKEAEGRAHAEVTAKAQADAAKKDAIEAARRKVAEERAK